MVYVHGFFHGFYNVAMFLPELSKTSLFFLCVKKKQPNGFLNAIFSTKVIEIVAASCYTTVKKKKKK